MICLLLIAFGTLLSDSGFVIVTEPYSLSE